MIKNIISVLHCLQIHILTFKITNNYAYFLKSKSIGNKLYKERFYYNNEPQVKSIATKLNTEIRKMENSINKSSLST